MSLRHDIKTTVRGYVAGLAAKVSSLVAQGTPSIAFFLVAVGMVLSASQAFAQTTSNYTFTILNGASGVYGATPYGINNKGQVVGVYGDGTRVHGFIYNESSQTYVTLDYPGATYTQANGINDNGVVVGNYDTGGTLAEPACPCHGFLFDGTNYINADPGGSSNIGITGINNAGQYVGEGNLLSNLTDPPSLLYGGFISTEGIASLLPDQYGIVPNFGFVSVGDMSPASINNAGTMVGHYNNNPFIGPPRGIPACNSFFNCGVMLNGSNYTILNPFGNSSSVFPSGINDKNEVVGLYASASTSGIEKGFIFDGTNYSTFNIPDASNLLYFYVQGINNAGDIVGTYVSPGVISNGFIATPSIVEVDPVPQLIDTTTSPPATKIDPDMLATGGRVVSGVAADGVSELVLRIPADTVGQQLTVTLYNDHKDSPHQSVSPDEDGALGNPGDTSFSSNQLTVKAQQTSAGPMAFVVYRAPVDFPRTEGQDALLSSRSVSIQASDASGNVTRSAVITILRPPVVLVHGLWGDPSNWDSFTPVINDPYNRFSTTRADYSTLIGPYISSFTPGDPNPIIQSALNHQVSKKAGANALGFAYTGPIVLQQIVAAIDSFKAGANVSKLQLAAVQADVVAHSMGGDITRYLPLLGNFRPAVQYAAGTVHKVITIDTPHLGSPLAWDLLQDQNRCVRNFFTLEGFTVLNSVQFVTGETVSGAINDLSHSPSDGTLSSVLQTLHQLSTPRLPTALIASSMSTAELAQIDTPPSDTAKIEYYCGSKFGNPLAESLTSASWPSVFGFEGYDSDAIVSTMSQLDGLSGISSSPLIAVHSGGAEQLGFGGPNALEQGSGGPNQVISLLNTSVTDGSTFLATPSALP